MLHRKNTPKILIIVTIIAIVLAIYSYRELNSYKKDPQAQTRREVQSLVTKVGRLTLLPTNETPTVATVSDPEALKDQAFFSQAVKGDKVLIYTQSKKAFLYSVSQNKIIDIAPLNIGDSQKVRVPTQNESTDNN